MRKIRMRENSDDDEEEEEKLENSENICTIHIYATQIHEQTTVVSFGKSSLFTKYNCI